MAVEAASTGPTEASALLFQLAIYRTSHDSALAAAPSSKIGHGAGEFCMNPELVARIPDKLNACLGHTIAISRLPGPPATSLR